MVISLLVVTQQESPGGISTQGMILALVLTIITSSSLGAIVQGFFSRSRLKGETLKLIEDAAAGAIESVSKQAGRVEAANDRLTVRVEHLEEERRAWLAEREEWRSAMRRHREWDIKVMTVLNEVSPDHAVPAPPPLHPANGTLH